MNEPIENIYSLNKVVIEGITYCEFNNEKTLSEVLKRIDGLKSETKPNDSTLTDFVEVVT